jgi:hypothetical protein
MKLIFVYNAKAGLLNGMMDSVHKTVSPDTYECDLCAITHGFFTMDKTWRNWLKSLRMETAFYHRPDFREAYPSARDWPLPLIALDRDGVLEPIIPAAEMKSLKTVDALVAALEAKLPG